MPSFDVSSRLVRSESEESTRNFRLDLVGVEDRRDEAGVQRAQPVDEVAQLGLGGDDLDVGVVRVQAPCRCR